MKRTALDCNSATARAAARQRGSTALDEGLEGVARVERRSEHALAELGRRRRAGRGAGARSARPLARVPSRKRGLRLAGQACAPAGCRARRRCGAWRVAVRTTISILRSSGILLPPQLGDQIEIVAVDPRSQEGGRHRNPDDAFRRLGELHAAEPARIDLAAEPCLQLCLDALETSCSASAGSRHIVPLGQISLERRSRSARPSMPLCMIRSPCFCTLFRRRARSAVIPRQFVPLRRPARQPRSGNSCPSPGDRLLRSPSVRPLSRQSDACPRAGKAPGTRT